MSDVSGARTQAALLTHAMDVPGRPVVTLAGEALAQVKDVLFDRSGSVAGFTLAGLGLLAGPLRKWLPWSAVHGFGPDAVMVTDEGALAQGRGPAVDGDVIGDQVLTRSGQAVGTVTDAVLRVERDVLDVVGYEIKGSDGNGEVRLIPLPDTLSVTAGRLVVPDAAVEFLTTDFAGFGAAVDTFRRRLREQSRGVGR